MNTTCIQLLLADDDEDDCMFFKEALNELAIDYSLKTVNDGEQLISWLTMHHNVLPDILFLDLNMPRKNGFECLMEIKINEKLKSLPIIIYSTSLDSEILTLLYEKGANYYIRKPGDFSDLKKIIHKALSILSVTNLPKASKENFVIRV